MLRFLQFSGFNSSVDAMDSQPRLRLQEICDRRMRVNITLERFIEYSILIRWSFKISTNAHEVSMAATTTVVMFLDLTSVHVAKDSSSVMT